MGEGGPWEGLLDRVAFVRAKPKGPAPCPLNDREAFLQHSAVSTGINVSDTLTDDVLACLADGTCSVSRLDGDFEIRRIWKDLVK